MLFVNSSPDITNISFKNRVIKRGTCIKRLIWPPLEPKNENCFSQISFDCFIKRMTEV